MPMAFNPQDVEDAARLLIGILNPHNEPPNVRGLDSVSQRDRLGLIVSSAATLMLNAIYQTSNGHPATMREGLDAIVGDMRETIDNYDKNRRVQ